MNDVIRFAHNDVVLTHSDVLPSAQNDVMFAHYAVKLNIIYAVNIIAAGNITCP